MVSTEFIISIYIFSSYLEIQSGADYV